MIMIVFPFHIYRCVYVSVLVGYMDAARTESILLHASYLDLIIIQSDRKHIIGVTKGQDI